ncbi:MAG: hypothetical protein K8T20_18670 [Planctomycetes bacterium]|nr:hypothetical protein [Planctomycetota bacterium]
MARAAVAFLLFVALASPAFAQGKPAPPDQPLQEARKKSLEELGKLRELMAKSGYKGEVDDVDSTIKRIMEPEKAIKAAGLATAWPGDDKHEEILKAWSEAGDKLAAIFTEAAGKLDGALKEEAEILSGWFTSWSHVADGIRRLNARRKFCKLTPVMEDWSGSMAGYLHGRYLQLNKNDPSTAGLGAHNENPKLPGATNDGAWAAGGILGGGPAAYCMDGWLGSAYHRDPVLSRNTSRVCFGGLAPNGWWSCRNAGGGGGQALGDIISFPGDGDTDISPTFGGEGPNPLQKFGETSSGTLFSVEFLRGKPKKPVVRLLEPDGTSVELYDIQSYPMIMAAKKPLKPATKYTIDIAGQDGTKVVITFTTSDGRGIPVPGNGQAPPK